MSDKPAFDPTQPFEAAPSKAQRSAPEKPAFDPDKPFETPKPKPSPSPEPKSNEMGFGLDEVWNGVKRIGRGVQVASDFVENKIDRPLREKFGLPRTGEDFSKKMGIGSDPVVDPSKMILMPTSAGEGLLNVMTGVPKDKLAGTAYEAAASTTNLIPPLMEAVKFFRPGAVAALENTAGRIAEKATGATAAQAEKFVPGSGKTLLKEGVVGFGMDQAAIAKAASEARETAGKNIGAIVKELESAGAPLTDRQELYASMLDRAEALKLGNQIDRDTGKALERVADDFNGNTSVDRNRELPLSEVAREKSGFDKLAKWDIQNQTPSASRDAYREAAKLLRGHIETVATGVSPELAEIFKHEKQLYAALSPIEAAAESKALKNKQSTWGGLTDIVAGSSVGPAVGTVVAHGTGSPTAGLIAGTLAGMGGAATRRVVGPRLASSAADILYRGSKFLGSEYAKPLEKVLQAGAIPAATISRIIETPEGRGVLKEILKDVATGNVAQPPREKRKSAFDGFKTRQKKGN